jgi:hypothetical protein
MCGQTARMHRRNEAPASTAKLVEGELIAQHIKAFHMEL